MRGRYYVFNGFHACSKADEKKLDSLLPKNFMGNAVEKLISEHGYRLNENTGVFYAPDGKKVCYFTDLI